MSKKKRLVQQKVETVINEKTGEIIEKLETEISRVSTSDSFIQMYLDDMSGILNIKNYSEFQVLAQLWKRSKFDTNEVILVKKNKEEIAEIIGTTLQNVNNTLSQLKRKKLLINKDRGVYYLNPKFFFKGYMQNRPTAMKVILQYEISDTGKAVIKADEESQLPGQRSLNI